MTDDNDNIVSQAASRQSLVQHFSIKGLFGYRTLTLDSDYAATILIARNGAGKTTMLGALDAFLRCQFGRLADLTFERIECKLQNTDELLTLEKKDLDQYMAKAADHPAIARMAKQYELDPADVLFFAIWDYPMLRHSRDELTQHPVYYKVYQQPAQTFESAEKQFKQIFDSIGDAETPISFLRKAVATAMADIEIVYLPTYRRIELSIPEPEDVRYTRKKSVQDRLGLTRRGLHAGDIQFGLSDISARLRKLNQEIMIESNQKYAEISANIVDDLISGSFEKQQPSLEDRPSRGELEIFFDRLKNVNKDFHFRGFYYPSYGPYGQVKIPDVSRIYSGNIPPNSEKFLTYFLGKLNSVIQKTRMTEQVVEKFVANCNRYLSADDPTTELDGVPTVEEKVLKLDRASLDVSVWRSHPDKEIPLDALSSGEKQMVSLFARLYLYPKKKLVLVDEPELSLSLDWQRKILPDILNSDLCQQVIAITHSPFIFDNELDAFAKALRVEIVDTDTAGA
ncbi:AAA family ATPase [Paraburkholderia sp. UCT2]|uniref:AAA family ATPase n=1 Tax=Paraburkholderia sp. UCT2 TaxID=2615208 RepID=UPI00165563B4|nr:AAA family ATPase [Paraburkholderia sp. UCT2]MBC8729433.1 AAA family ATPase [Paraburkholderia sp. UCT2]